MAQAADPGVSLFGEGNATASAEPFIVNCDATKDDVDAMVSIFIESFRDDPTAQLLYTPDAIRPIADLMIKHYMADDYSHVRVTWDEKTGTMLGWTSVSIVAPDEEEVFRFCDSTVWAGRRSLMVGGAHPRGGLPASIEHQSEERNRRVRLTDELSRRNRDGQKSHIRGKYLVISTLAIHPDAFKGKVPDIAFALLDDARDVAMAEGLPLWAQFPGKALGDLEGLFAEIDFEEVGERSALGDLEGLSAEIGFEQVGSFELDLTQYASEALREQRQWGYQKWTQWVLRAGNWEQGRRDRKPWTPSDWLMLNQ